MPLIGSRPLRSRKSVEQGQPQAQPQQRSSPQLEPEAHPAFKSWHQPASSSHSMADARWRPPTQRRGVIAGTRPAHKAPVPHSSGDSSTYRSVGHARLQRYWSALQKGTLHGESMPPPSRPPVLSVSRALILLPCTPRSKLLQAAS